ncbi:hypothetical protein [Tessaracoccus sp.]
MSDDLSNLSPTDPSRVAPNWASSRERILDGVLAEDAPSRSHPWRWVAGAAAAALVAVAVGGIVQQMRPEPYAVPASPTSSPTASATGPVNDSPLNPGQVVAAQTTLLDTGGGMTLCNGLVLQSRPPQCPFTTPVSGITWQDVPWAETASGTTFTENVIIVGTFDGYTFVATDVFREGDPAAPHSPATIHDEDLPTLCENPTRGTGAYSVEALMVAAENLPGYQALWVSPNQVTYNIAVTEDVEGARSALSEVFGGEMCVGTLQGPTDQTLQAAQLSLEPLTMDEGTATTADDAVWSTSVSVSTRGNRLEVFVRRDTPELLAQIEAAVGEDVWPHTDVWPFFYTVNDVAPTPQAPAPTPSTLPQTDGTYMAQGGLEYRNGQLSLCYSMTYASFNSCRAAVPLFGLDPQDVDWTQGSVDAGRAFMFDAVVVGTIEDNGLRVERMLDAAVAPGDVGVLPRATDTGLLSAAAADLMSSYDGDPFAPTTEVDETDPEGARLIVHVLLATDEVRADVRNRVGEDIWQYTSVRAFITTLES